MPQRQPTSRRLLAAGILACTCALASCSSESASPEVPSTTSVASQVENGGGNDAISTPAWPAPDWDTVGVEVAGLDAEALADIAEAAEEGGSDCLVVTRHGRIVDERYWSGTEPDEQLEAYSVTKSITSTLVGIAQDRGLLDIDQPASDFITEWVGTPSESVTIRNLLSNDSGRFQTAASDYLDMAALAADKSQYAIGLTQEHEPGTFWVYNNAAIQTLEEVLQRATGMEMREFASEALFEPLGMDAEIDTDVAGNTLAFMGAQMSCRDMARFGLLFLRGGEWDGTRVVSEDWVQAATSPSTLLNSSYGYLWWLFGGESGDPEAFAALGLGGQIIAVFPEHDLVITRMGSSDIFGQGGFNISTLTRLVGDLVVPGATDGS